VEMTGPPGDSVTPDTANSTTTPVSPLPPDHHRWIQAKRAGRSTARAQMHAYPARTPKVAPTSRGSHSRTRTETAACSKRSRRDLQDASGRESRSITRQELAERIYGSDAVCSGSDSALRSSRRELTPILANTLPRCHSTVRALMNSWAPISGLVCPSRASRAISAS
jgi:hypothetical protein